MVELPENVERALVAIAAGSTADAQESQELEFKVGLISALIDKSIAFANSDRASGTIVVGVNDRETGRRPGNGFCRGVFPGF